MANLVYTERTTQSHRELLRKIKSRYSGLSSRQKYDYALFTTNYDLLLERACDDNTIICVNGFIGKITGKWDPSYFAHDITSKYQTTKGSSNRQIDNRINLYKLHGSITWQKVNDILYELFPSPDAINVEIILPSISKSAYTQVEPYDRLFREFSEALNMGYNLVTIGYGFGDEHINQFVFKKI